MEKKKINIAGILQNYGAVIFFFALLLFNCLFTHNFIKIQTFWNIFIQSLPTMLLGFGATLVISSGAINLSVGSMIGLGATIFAIMINAGANFFVSIIACMLVAVIPGLVCGILTSKFQMPPLIVTMSFMYILRGLAQVICGGFAVTYDQKWILNLTMVKVLGLFPIHLIVTMIVFLTLYFFVQKTTYGLQIQATGANRVAASISGVNVNYVVVVCFVISSVLAGFLGAEQAMMVSIGDPNFGSTSTFDGVCATVIGGTPMRGGRANLVGTFFAALFLQLITITMNMHGIHYAYAYVVNALLIFVSCSAQVIGQKFN